MSLHRAGAVLALAGTLAIPTVASAAPANVQLRVEGVSSTIFDGLVRTDGRTVQAKSDTVARTCDGTNLDANADAGPTPTGAAVDAMDLLAEDFDGDWYDGFEDYFVTEFAGERQNPDAYSYFGVLANGAFTPVGGCQYRVNPGDQVLWANDAFNGRPFLAAAPQSTIAVAGQPFTVQVGGAADLAQATADPAGNAYQGAKLQIVDAIGRPSAVTPSATTTSDAAGKATITFKKAGWYRVKARGAAASAPSVSDAAVPASAIDVCVRPKATSPACAGPAPSTQLAAPTAPKLEGTPSAIAFGAVAAGTTVTKTVTLTNSGQKAITGLTATLTGVNTGKFTVTGVPAKLSGGASATVSVSYAPPAKNSVSAAVLKFAGTGGQKSVALTGRGR